MAADGLSVVDELQARLAVTDGLNEGEYVVESQGLGGQKRAPPNVPTGPAVFVLRTGLKLRQGAALTSELAGDGGIRAGARVHVVETTILEDGTERKNLAYEGHDVPIGWVTASTKGESNLLTEAESQAAHAALLTAAITGRELSPSPKPAPSPQKKLRKLPTFGGGGQKCLACGKTAYQAERMKVGDHYFHVNCMRCVECGPDKRLGSEYGVAMNADGVLCLYCVSHEIVARQSFPQQQQQQDLANEAATVEIGEAAHERGHITKEQQDQEDVAWGGVGVEVAEPTTAATTTATTAATTVATPAGLGTAADRQLEEAIKTSARGGAPAVASTETSTGSSDRSPLARCFQCF